MSTRNPPSTSPTVVGSTSILLLSLDGWEPFGARTVETASHQEHVAPATLSETGGRRSWRRIGRPLESRKIQEKNRHFRKHRYDVGIVKAEARGPTRSVPSARRGDVKRSPNGRFTIRCSWAFGVGERMLRKRRNEKAVKLLKTNDLAKRRDFAGNDSNDLRPAVRNLSFRHAKDSVRFRGFWASSRPEAQSPCDHSILRLRLQIVAGLKSWTAKSCAKEVLRPWNPWRA